MKNCFFSIILILIKSVESDRSISFTKKARLKKVVAVATNFLGNLFLRNLARK